MARERGDVVARAVVEAALGHVLTVLRENFLALADRQAAHLVLLDDERAVRDALHGAVHAELAEVASAFKRLAGEESAAAAKWTAA